MCVDACGCACVLVDMCVYVREKESVCVCVCVLECVYVRECVSVCE